MCAYITFGASFRDYFCPKLIKVPTLRRNWTSAQAGVQHIQDFTEYYVLVRYTLLKWPTPFSEPTSLNDGVSTAKMTDTGEVHSSVDVQHALDQYILPNIIRQKCKSD